MKSGVTKARTSKRTLLRGPRPWAFLGLALGSSSCVPVAFSQSAPLAVAAAPAAPAVIARPGLIGIEGLAQPAAMPLTGAENLAAAASFTFAGRTPLDTLRSLDCLAQAIYYEAASESEAGQRAVAQVVLNRVRHPAWPNSVCGVVYQGPMRAGGGCQFTFTCDGSLMRRAGGSSWDQARRLAGEALAGTVFAPVGFSTHYHTQAVSPSWAPRLARTTTIGAHHFYALPGLGGTRGAFTAAYAGAEPLARPNPILFPRAGTSAIQARFDAFIPATPAEVRAAVALPSDIPADSRWTAANLPESTIREEYRTSGQWREDAPAALTGQR